MAVHVEDRLDARVPEPRCDDSGVGAFGDEERNVAVSEVVEPHRLADRTGHGGEPDASSEAVDEEEQLLAWAERRRADDSVRTRVPPLGISEELTPAQAEAMAAVTGRGALERPWRRACAPVNHVTL